MRRCAALWIGGAALVALLSAPVHAQTAMQSLTGNECWRAGQGPGGIYYGDVCTNTLRNSTANVATTVTGNITLGTGTTSSLADGGNLLITAQPSAATITLPANTVPDGAQIGICNVTGSAFATNVVSLAANSGQTLNTAVAVTTQAAGTCAIVQWNAATSKWYRIQ